MYFKQNSCDGGVPNPTGSLPVFHQRPSYAQKVKYKLNPIKNPSDMHVHNSFSNLAIHMPHPLRRVISIGNGFHTCAYTSDCNG